MGNVGYQAAARLLILLLAAPLPEGMGRQWQTGRLDAAEISGHGSGSQTRAPSNSRSRSGTSSQSRRDIWWTYRIISGDQTYSAVSRESPAKSGLAVNSLIRFSVEKGKIYISGKNGQHVLRILSVRPTKTPSPGLGLK
jgi:hypothetical protein